MYDRKKQIMERIQKLDEGSASPSGRYWCVTCKKMFRMEDPVCPYMTRMCVNTPIAVENIPPESSVWVEKMGLFYPKLPQRVMASMSGEPEAVGGKWAQTYLDFLEEWKIDCGAQPLQTLKSFIIFAAGSETAQRVNESSVTLVITDLGKVWDKDRIFAILRGALPVLRKRLGIEQELLLDDMDIIGDRPMGRYYCAMCRKFFEFGIPREKIVCPLMSQKCMFDPVHIDKIDYDSGGLLKMYRISPDLYRRFMLALSDRERGRKVLRDLLQTEWNLVPGQEELNELEELLGLG